MSQYSEIVGSFLRRGSFPLEADYLFTTVDELKSYYEKEENKAILHRGLLKVVEDDGNGNQGLFWVTLNSDSNELEFTELMAAGSSEELGSKLDELQQKLDEEIKNRQDADSAIYGTSDPTTISADLDSILDLSKAVTELKQQISDATTNQENLRKDLLAAVGMQEDSDIVEYLNTLDYGSITALSNRLDTFFNSVNTGGIIDTWQELQNFLTGISDDQKLTELLTSNLNTIYGNPIPTEEFRTLRGVEDFVRALQSNLVNAIRNVADELDITQTGVGLNADGSFSADSETNYLTAATSVMNALKILDAKVKEISLEKTFNSNNSDVIQLYFNNTSTNTTIDAVLKLSAESGNNLIKKNDGLYIKVNSEYADGILTIRVNDNIVGQHYIGLDSVITDAKYDPTTEELVLVFRSGQTVRVPLTNLIREWVVDNSIADKVVELTREEAYAGNPDKLSADVRLLVDKYNILVKSGNALYVKGTSDNIVHNDVKVSIILDKLIENSGNQDTEISNIHDQITDINNSISETNSKVEEISNNFDQIQEDFNTVRDNLMNHLTNTNNPHNVTSEQVGTYDKETIDGKLSWVEA